MDTTTHNERTVILAEDDQFISRAYVAGLQQAGFRVVPVYRGDEVVHAIEREHPDIVLLDLIMPFKTGFEILETLHTHPTAQRVPVFVFSSLAQDKDKDEAFRLGAKDYIEKSNVTLQEVVDKIQAYLGAG